MDYNEIDLNQVNIEDYPPEVIIAEDNMTASVILPRLPEGVRQLRYGVKNIINALNDAGVTYGIDQDKIIELVEHHIYDVKIPLAFGLAPEEGVPGEFTYHFDTELNPEPTIREDGSVDYKDMKTIETVEAGDVIATYRPAVPGIPGRNVLGVEVMPTLVRDLPPLPGKGFDRSEDGKVYTANTTGKIEIVNKRVIISPVYELKGKVGVDTGNIDFSGDVIIHGTVTNGVVVKATGNITVDGLVENCILQSKKDIYLLAGVKGSGTTEIRANGDIKAQFIELATVYSGGNIEADVFYDSTVSCNGYITLAGKKGSIVGGSAAAVEGITCKTLGNEFGVITKVFAGTTPSRAQEKHDLEKQFAELERNLNKIKAGLKKFDEMGEDTGVSYREDPRRIQLLRVKIRDEAVLEETRMKIEEISNVLERGKRATIKTEATVYVGTEVGINNHKLRVKETQKDIEFVRTDEGIRMQHMKS